MHDSATRDRKSILFIAYHFPPSAAVGGQRIANFASAIRRFGWQPHVLTIADDDVERIDRARLADVEGIRIDKAPVRRRTLQFAEWLWTRFRRSRFSGAPTNARAAGTKPTAQSPPIPARRGMRRFLLSFVALPDWERGWCVPATLQAVRTIRRHRLDWFMTSCPPYSVHLIGLAVKRLTGRRWIADFRDPWMTTGFKRLYPTSGLSMRIESFLERRVIEQADLVVFNVSRLRDAYRERYSWVPEHKFVFIPNGLKERVGQEPVRKFERFTIAYTGSLYVGRSPEPILQAVARLIASGRITRQSIHVRLVGQCDVIEGEPAEAVIRRHGLEGVVEVQSAVPYQEAFDIIRRSHLALLLAPNLPYQIPAKVYDYLAAGTRILAVAEEGGTADLLNETASGRAFRSDEIEGMSDFIAAEMSSAGARSGTLSPVLDRYQVGRITQDLVDRLERISGETPAGTR